MPNIKPPKTAPGILPMPEDLRRVRPVKALGELTEPGFKYLSGIIRNPVNLRRARHAVTEN